MFLNFLFPSLIFPVLYVLMEKSYDHLRISAKYISQSTPKSYFFLDFLCLCFLCGFISSFRYCMFSRKLMFKILSWFNLFPFLLKNLSPAWFCGSVSIQVYLSRNCLLLEFLWIDLYIYIRKLLVYQGSHSLLSGLRNVPNRWHSKKFLTTLFLLNRGH